jgi:hypothetical protein
MRKNTGMASTSQETLTLDPAAICDVGHAGVTTIHLEAPTSANGTQVISMSITEYGDQTLRSDSKGWREREC